MPQGNRGPFVDHGGTNAEKGEKRRIGGNSEKNRRNFPRKSAYTLNGTSAVPPPAAALIIGGTPKKEDRKKEVVYLILCVNGIAIDP